MATLNEAKAAKERAKEMLADVGELRGIGIARTEDGFGVKVNLAHEIEQHIPATLNGVPLVVEIVGEIRPFDGAAPEGPRAKVIAGENNEERDMTLAPDVTPANLSPDAPHFSDEDARY